MRTGSCGSVQQGLTSEAASIVKEAVTLAKRRGHAQVTPLHVANTMLSITNGLFRRACLQSHSHPLQCKALELCFNVALNRLPASSSSSSSSSSAMLLGSPPHHQSPASISNALVAAFKRAQAHQRRGSIIENQQQQQLLAVKIELEQLVISILDDPSVSRVMREAGFSSTQVKANVEHLVSLEICAHNNNINNNNIKSSKQDNNNLACSTRESISMVGSSKSSLSSSSLVCDPVREEDVASVIDNLGKQRGKSVVILGESLVGLEGVVRGVMDKVDKGDVCESLRGVKFVSLSGFSHHHHVSTLEVDQKIEELRNLLLHHQTMMSSNSSRGGGYVLYLGDLKWVVEYGGGYNSAVDHMVMEIGKLLVSTAGRFWIMGIATFRDYMRSKCKNNNGHHPSLEALWGLHPITIPAATLRLTLLTHSDSQNQSGSEKADDDDDQNGTISTVQGGNTCNTSDSSRSSLPTWLQQYKDNERKAAPSHHQQNCVQVGDLCKKWSSMCSSSVAEQQPYPSLTFSSASPSSSSHERSTAEPTMRIYIPEINNTTNQPLFFSPSNRSNSSSSSDAYASRFRELNSENMTTLCDALEEKVPWQKHIIPEVVTTVLQCRSGMVGRRGNKLLRSNNNNEWNSSKQETWLFFQGADIEAKERVARELARLVFGCESSLVSIALMSSFSSSRADSDYCRNKRSREEAASCSYINRFADAVSRNPHRVFVVEDIEQADWFSHVGFKRAMERGTVIDSNGEEVGVGDAIVILSCQSFSSSCCSPSPSRQKSREGSQEDNIVFIGDHVANDLEASPCVSLDLNICIDDRHEDQSLDDDVGLIDSVDRRIVFKFQEL